MKRKITFKMFFTVLWRGICQAVRWVASMFGYKDGTAYGIVVRRIFAGSLAIVAFVIAAVFAYAGYEAISDDIRQEQYCKSELTERLYCQSFVSLLLTHYSLTLKT